MGSHEQSDGTSYQPSEPKPCANNCGFFGSAGTMNLCSKCYRDFSINEDQTASAKAAMEKSFNAVAKKAESQTMMISDIIEPNQSPVVGSPSSPTETVSGGDRIEPKASNRCSTCNRKVGLTGFKCKCGSMYCGTHRYPEKHDCVFDFKASGRDAIAKANPVVKADKIQRL